MSRAPQMRMALSPSLTASLLGAVVLTARADGLNDAVPSAGHLMPWVLGLAVAALVGVAVIMQRMRASTSTVSFAAMPELNGLDSDGFKRLVADVYRRRGYEVREAGDAAADADLLVTKDNQQSLVLCRHWQRAKVGMRQVRALYGAMASHSAQTGVVITAGSFVADAFRFAGLGHIELVDHTRLSGFLHSKPSVSQRAAPADPQLQAGTA